MNIELLTTYKEEIISPFLGTIQSIFINLLIFFITDSLGFIPQNVLVLGSKSFSISHIVYTEIILGIISIATLIYLTKNYKENLSSYFGYFIIFVIAFCSILPILITYAPIQLIVAIELMILVTAVCIYSSVSRRIFNK